MANDALTDSLKAMRARSSSQNRPQSKWPTTPQSDMFARVRGCAAVQEIGDWLEKLGMPEYAEDARAPLPTNRGSFVANLPR
jgi:hypothetical protein